MVKILKDYEEHLLNNLLEDEDFIQAKNIYIDLVITKDLTAIIIPNKINLKNSLIDIEIKGFEAVIIPTHIDILCGSKSVNELTVDFLIELLPDENRIKELIKENKSLIEIFINENYCISKDVDIDIN